MSEYISKRLGDQCWFSGVDCCTAFNADLKEMKQPQANITSDYAKQVGMSSLKLYNHKVKIYTLEMTFIVTGSDARDAMINVSKLLASAKDTVVKTDKSDFEYPAVLTGFKDNDTGIDEYHEVVLTFACIKRMGLVTANRTSNIVINNEGTCESGLKIEATFTSFQDTAIVNGYIIKNVKANIPFVIDGITGKVTQDGENRIQDTTFTKFPKIEPGSNAVSIPSGCSVKFSYYPTFM